MQIWSNHQEHRPIFVSYLTRTSGAERQSSIRYHTAIDRFQVHIGKLSIVYSECSLDDTDKNSYFLKSY